jgi:signal transduction histidine kinase
MNSIRRRLTRDILLVALVLLGGGLLALYFAARHAAMEQFDEALRAKALAVSTMTLPSPDGLKVLFTDRFMRGFDDRSPNDYFEMWNGEGQSVARSESLVQGELPLQVGSLENPRRRNLPLPNGRPGRAIGFTFHPRDPADPKRVEPELQLVVVSDRRALDETLHGLLWVAAGCATLLTAATLWLVPRVLHRGLEPLQALGTHAAGINAGSLSVRFPTRDLPLELQPITARLNDLLARLEASFDRERRFSADLAHELRTPLAELRSLAECALKWPEGRDPFTDRETLSIAQQMETLVTHMLALARGEHGQLTIHLEPLALDELVRRIWLARESRVGARQLLATLHIEPVSTTADRALLSSIVTNLCDNAVDYTPAGGEIRVGVESKDGVALLRISNTTADLEPSDVPHLFDRFWRKENARSGGGAHLGLGLPIARTFAAAMGWTLTATAEVPGRLTFVLTSAANS